MTRVFARIFALVAVLAPAGQDRSVSASARHVLTPQVEILVDGVPQPRYSHRGRWYVEALNGREYAIRIHNPYGVRVAVALAVDGLNTIDARHTTPADARKWVIDPHGSITISGWQTSRTQARRFEFTTEAKSYAQALGSAANVGVISAVFFRERIRAEQETMTEAVPAAPPAPQAERRALERDAAAQSKSADNDYAATGMGRATDHRVVQVSLDLEGTPAHRIDIRYEFRPQLVRLGVLPAAPDRLRDRERASGFEPGFSPVLPRLR